MEKESLQLLRPFQFEKLPFRGRLIRLGHLKSIKSLTKAHTTTLTEMLCAAATLTHDLKGQANISLQITSKEGTPLFVAKCNYKGELRAFVTEAATAAETPQTERIFTLSVDYGKNNNSYQSIIPLDGENMSKTLTAYFQNATNLPTLFKVFTNAENTACGAIFLQATQEPQNTRLQDGWQDDWQDDWKRMGLLIETIKPEEILPGNLTEVNLISRLFAEDDVRLFPKMHLSFADQSNRPRMEEALKSLGVAECRTLLKEEGGTFTMTDEYTGQSEIFTQADLATLFGDAWEPI